MPRQEFKFEVTMGSTGQIRVRADSVEEAMEIVKDMTIGEIKSNTNFDGYDIQVWPEGGTDDDYGEPFLELG